MASAVLLLSSLTQESNWFVPKQEIRLKFEVKKPPPRRLPWILALFLVTIVVVLLAERWRGQWLLNRWKTAMAARGTTIDPIALWPAPSDNTKDFTNCLAASLAEVPQDLKDYAAAIKALSRTETGAFQRGSQAPEPECSPKLTALQSWDHLQELVQQAEPSLSAIRRLMLNPPTTPCYNVRELLENDAIPNFFYLRQTAQVLNAATLVALHHHDLEATLENLTALSACVKMYSQDPFLVTYMVRVAILGLTVDTYWDALQEEGWTDSQLSSLQKACESTDLFSQLPRPLQAEISIRVHRLESFRARSYNAWLHRYVPIYESFAAKPPDTSLPSRLWRQWVFHPLWSFSWADLEQLNYLQTIEPDMMALRAVADSRSWIALKQQLDANRSQDPRRRAGWRFYGNLPLMDELVIIPPTSNTTTTKSGFISFSAITSLFRTSQPIKYPDFSRAWFTTMRNLTLHQMLMSAIALKRYQLNHGQLPPTLKALAPKYLRALPRDLMDGQPLRYRLNPDQTFTLYSVGEDGEDNGGNTSQAPYQPSTINHQPLSSTGKDYTWPQLPPTPAADASILSMHPQE